MIGNTDFFVENTAARLADLARDKVSDFANVFIFPFKVHTGYQDLSDSGIKGQGYNPSSFVEFKRVWTGKAMIISQWENSIDIHTRAIRSKYSYFDFACFRNVIGIDKSNDDIFSYEWDLEAIQKVLIPSKSEFEGLIWDGNLFGDKTLDQVLNDLKNDNNIFVSRHGAPKDNGAIDNFLYKDFHKGSFRKGMFVSSNLSSTFQDYNAGSLLGDYTQQSNQRKITLRLLDRVSKDDLYKFYWIPQYLNANPSGIQDEVQWLYISNSQEYLNENGEFVYCEVEFSSVNDALLKTGQTISQFIQFSAIGEGACLPALIYDENNVAKDFKINPNMIGDNGVRSIQIEQIGVAATSSIKIVGRPIANRGEFNQKIYPSRDLLMEDIKYPVVDGISKQSSPSNKFVAMNAIPEIESYFGSWQEATKSTYTDTMSKNYDGFIETDATKTLESNSVDNGLVVQDDDMTFKGCKSLDNKYDIRSSGYIASKSKTNVSETAMNLSKVNSKGIQSYLNLGSYLFQQFITLPLTLKEQTTWNLRDIPVIGNLLNKITFGLPIGWRQIKELTPEVFARFVGVSSFMDKFIYQFYNDSFWPTSSNPTERAKNTGRIPFSAFKSTEKDKFGGLIGIDDKSSAWLFNLTDKCNVDIRDTKTQKYMFSTKANTIFLGATSLVNPNITCFYPSGEALELPAETLISKDYTDTNDDLEPYYIIDAIALQAIHQGDIRISAFDEDPDEKDYKQHSVFQTTIQSQSAWTNNIRDWLTLYKTSYLDEFINDNVSLNWPNVQPKKPEPDIDDIVIKKSIINSLQVDHDLDPGWEKVTVKGKTKYDGSGSAAPEFDNYDYPTSPNGTIEYGYPDGTDFNTGNGSSIADYTYRNQNELMVYDFGKLLFKTWGEVKTNYPTIKFNIDYALRSHLELHNIRNVLFLYKYYYANLAGTTSSDHVGDKPNGGNTAGKYKKMNDAISTNTNHVVYNDRLPNENETITILNQQFHNTSSDSWHYIPIDAGVKVWVRNEGLKLYVGYEIFCQSKRATWGYKNNESGNGIQHQIAKLKFNVISISKAQ